MLSAARNTAARDACRALRTSEMLMPRQDAALFREEVIIIVHARL